jgi:predicted nucleotidyltransferase
MDEWTIVQTKSKTKTKVQSLKHIINNNTFNNIKDIVVNILSKYKIAYIYIYGSRARGTNKINSDIDIMCFMKYPIPNTEKLSNIKKELIQSLNLNVDFVVMHLTNKYIKVSDDRTKCYYDNVLIDAKCIYPLNININLHDLIDNSIKLEKIE